MIETTGPPPTWDFLYSMLLYLNSPKEGVKITGTIKNEKTGEEKYVVSTDYPHRIRG